MAYSQYYAGGWKDSPLTTTPIVAAALQNMETGIATAQSTADTATTNAAAAQTTGNAATTKATLTTTGDMYYASAPSTPARLGIGTANQGLLSISGIPTWGASLQSLMTATGDITYASGANTPARLAVGSTGQLLTVAGGVPTWATFAAAGAQLDFAQITASPTAVSATTEGTAVAQITGNSITYDGTRVKVEVFIPAITTSAAAAITFVVLRDATVLGQIRSQTSSTGNSLTPPPITVFDTPSAGAHTYKVSAFVSANTATVGAGAGGAGNLPAAFLRVTKA